MVSSVERRDKYKKPMGGHACPIIFPQKSQVRPYVQTHYPVMNCGHSIVSSGVEVPLVHVAVQTCETHSICRGRNLTQKALGLTREATGRTGGHASLTQTLASVKRCVMVVPRSEAARIVIDASPERKRIQTSLLNLKSRREPEVVKRHFEIATNCEGGANPGNLKLSLKSVQ
jgi:hypothetical protein